MGNQELKWKQLTSSGVFSFHDFKLIMMKWKLEINNVLESCSPNTNNIIKNHAELYGAVSFKTEFAI